MPTKTHEILIQLVRDRPSIVATFLSESLEVPVPEFAEARLESAEFNECSPVEYRADAVVSLGDGSPPELAVVVEVQLSVKPRKRRTWPHYLAMLRDRMDCPVMLLVLAADKNVASWCAQPIDMGHPGWTLRPLVLGPDRVPVIADPRQAAAIPELAVLSAYTHGSGLAGPAVLRAFLTALEVVDGENRRLYSDFVYSRLSEAAQKELKALMGVDIYEYESDFARAIAADVGARSEALGEARGEARGEAKAVLITLEARGISVPEEGRKIITDCTDLATLETWLRRAASASTLSEVFDADPLG